MISKINSTFFRKYQKFKMAHKTAFVHIELFFSFFTVVQWKLVREKTSFKKKLKLSFQHLKKICIKNFLFHLFLTKNLIFQWKSWAKCQSVKWRLIFKFNPIYLFLFYIFFKHFNNNFSACHAIKLKIVDGKIK